MTITDPLVKYQTLIAGGKCSPDAAQHRLAIHLQKIYHRLKDYSPSIEYRARLKAISDTLEKANRPRKDNDGPELAVENHPIRRNPLFARFFSRTRGEAVSLALTRVLKSHEAAIEIDSPQGLFLSGEVGTGKSMLLDMLADGLPTSRKKRWHFNTFMLYTLSRLEHYRKTHTQLDGDDQHYSMLWLAKDMVENSPILFLDEFQLPDRAASKILCNLFTAFFQLGGVLVASSNRMPEELEKATGFEHVPAHYGGLMRQVFGTAKKRGRGELFGSSSDFANFLEVLKARCEFWQMEGAKDWRRLAADERSPDVSPTDNVMHSTWTIPEAPDISKGALQAKEPVEKSPMKRPKNFHIASETDGDLWDTSLKVVLAAPTTKIPWTSSTLVVYGRTITIPQQCNGITYWDFEDLAARYGPADYITMASTFHTFIIDGIPVLTAPRKNEARRLITLLDALYEARCKLVVRADAGPDDLFFPESKAASSTAPDGRQVTEKIDSDAILPETIAEVHQDQQSPFRPNISSYKDPDTASYNPDQDSDFGIVQKSRLDFSNTAAFTGEDERFAFKRSASRLWELCGERWHARTGDWWQPLPLEARHWEHSPATKPAARMLRPSLPGDASMGPAVELEESAGLQRLRLTELREAALKGDWSKKLDGQ